ncbi:histidinol-phosphate transaminase [Vibrio alginolyticus]|nr:histidinol-phosphate transaminase [Vibrio alginolyticus]MDW1970148.1 histidinol-phosphate transaminase [Vibrio sp. 945]
MFLNKVVNDLNPYKVTSHKAWENIGDKSVLKLDWNEATIPPSPKVNEALIDFIQNGRLNWYPETANLKLKKKLAEYVDVEPDNLEYFSSSDGLHEYILRAFVDYEDTVVMIAPTYDNFRAVAESVGARVDYYYLDKKYDYKFDIEDFSDYLNQVRPKAVYLCNPNNPTGNIYSPEEIKTLIKRFNDVLFIVDEAYYEFNTNSASHFVNEYENILICRTFSKAFGLASIRFGYAISSKQNITGISKIRNPKSVSSFAQVAAMAALDDVEYMWQYVNEINCAKDIFIENLRNLGVKVLSSAGGNFVFVDLENKADRCIEQLEQRNIFIRSYSKVGRSEGLVRITVGTREQMSHFMSIFEDVYTSF